MVFASLPFLTVFLPLALLAYALTPARQRNLTLLLSSWLFYGWWHPAFLLLFVMLTVCAWLSGLALDRVCRAEREAGSAGRSGVGSRRRSGVLLAALIVANLAVLAWFKYANIVMETVARLATLHGAAPLAWQRIVLPIGLSFTVLQIISYLVDIRRGRFRAERRPIAFATYLAMFGHLVAGPIIRYDWIRRRLRHRRLRWRNLCAGSRRFMVGLAMKVLVADTLAPVVAQVFGMDAPRFADAWLGCLAYTLQLYFDFAGYSAMAIGIGTMLGFRFPENFAAPYLAADLAGFWRRWHISLSSWLRDYLYIPLGGSRRGPIRTAANLLATMALGGLWHGADSWNFLYWGVAHGLGLIVVHGWRASGLRLPTLCAHALTLLFVMMCWTLFRSPDLHTALALLAAQLHVEAVPPSVSLQDALRTPVVLAYAAGIVGVLLPALRRPMRRPACARQARADGASFRAVAALAGRTTMRCRTLLTCAAALLSVALVASRGTVPFLYFQF
ncbi:MBOAT family O-acyltransferase [Chitinasiproducens palmae]|uniref:Probable alginate O-acetylase AlgI n=1 Tax=Chitinasiproducens palmae TaxID=1770053 RepID=A0A1H2PVF4_9BURK|nr:MBOAT family O-acyltransferase [Chitinasiproducens palmae]SDV51257.1 alginate O-acetyltransferase complex protein AlgI [Chitinasiproducens palmae]